MRRAETPRPIFAFTCRSWAATETTRQRRAPTAWVPPGPPGFVGITLERTRETDPCSHGGRPCGGGPPRARQRGATFPYPIYAKWADAYKKETGIGLNYQSIGSGGGIKQIQSKTVTFGASDMPLSTQELNKFGLLQFPTVIGGVVPVINVEGIKSGDIVIDGPTLAKIFMTEIKTWNDPAIQKLNPSAKLPAQPIV